MKMDCTVHILPRAERDIQRIFAWLAERTPGGACRWYVAFEEAVDKLPPNPFRYGLAPENEAVDYEVRQFLFKTRHGRTYRGVFTVVDNEIRVLRVRGPGQPPLEHDELCP
jgi:plasmid stabilization system protein ParE